MKKATGSFIFLIIIAIIAAGAAYLVDTQMSDRETQKAAEIKDAPKHEATAPEPAPEPEQEVLPTIDTTAWKTYVSRGYPFTFKYPEKWTAVPHPTENEYEMIVITPNDGSAAMTVYLSKKTFLGLDGLQSEPITVSSVTGSNIQNMLVGLQYLDTYYTYDLGNSPHKAEFMAMVNSTQFLPKK